MTVELEGSSWILLAPLKAEVDIGTDKKVC